MIRRSNIGVNIALAFGSLIFFWGITEMTLRLTSGTPPNFHYQPWRAKGVAYTLTPHSDYPIAYIDRTVHLPARNQAVVVYKEGMTHINSWGIRDVEYPKGFLDSKKVVLCLGDSTTFGIGVTDRETYAKQLQQLLQRAGSPDAWVINSGVGGYNLWDYRYYFEYLLQHVKPAAVVVGICTNDSVRAPLSSSTRAMLETHSVFFYYLFKAIDVLAVRLQSPSLGHIQEYLSRYVEGSTRQAALKYSEMAGVPSDIAFAIRTFHDAAGWRRALANIDAIKAICDQRHIHLIGAVFPTEFQMIDGYIDPEPQRTIEAYFRSREIPLADMRPIFHQEYASHRQCFSLQTDYIHFDSNGHYLTAKAIFPYVRKALNNQ
jgi:lysophospholipase L1-like esterase